MTLTVVIGGSATPPRMWLFETGRYRVDTVPLFGDGVALARVFSELRWGGDWVTAALVLADWVDDHAADLCLPEAEHLRYEIGPAIRAGSVRD